MGPYQKIKKFNKNTKNSFITEKEEEESGKKDNIDKMYESFKHELSKLNTENINSLPGTPYENINSLPGTHYAEPHENNSNGKLQTNIQKSISILPLYKKKNSKFKKMTKGFRKRLPNLGFLKKSLK